MQDKNWLALKRIVDAPDFSSPVGFDKSLLGALKKAVEAKAKLISSTTDQKMFPLEWLREICRMLGIRAEGKTRAPFLKDAFVGLYQEGKEERFWKEVSLKRDKQRQEELRRKNELNEQRQEELRRKEILQDLYNEFCSVPESQRLEKLKSYFVQEDGLEEKLKEFRKELGIRAGGSQKTKLESRLKAISQELERRRASDAIR
jgi:hypothetical protein